MKYLIAALAVFLMFVGSVDAQLACRSAFGDCNTGETELFRFGSNIVGSTGDNAHAQLTGQTPKYANSVCCSGVIGLDNTCGIDSATVIKLESPTNSHAGDSSSSYTNNVCLTSQLEATCQTISSSQSCVDSVCVIKLSGLTNAHVSSCDAVNNYPHQICCSASDDTDPPTVSILGISKENDGSPDVYSNSRTIYAIGLSNLGGAAACNITWGDGSYNNLLVTEGFKQHTYNSDGNKTVEYSCVDEFGNKATPVQAKISIDTVKPLVTMDGISSSLSGPLVNLFNTRTIYARGLKENDTAGVIDSGTPRCVIIWNFPRSLEIIPSSVDSMSHTYASDELFSILYACLDGAGNLGLSQYEYITIDTTPPTTIDNVEAITYGSNVFIDLTCDDSVPDVYYTSGCRNTYYCVYTQGAPQCNPATIGNIVSVSCPTGQQCSKIIRYYSDDNILNTESIKESIVIQLDANLVTCEMTNLTEFSTSLDIDLSWSAQDPLGISIRDYKILYREDTSPWQLFNTFSHPTTSVTFSNTKDNSKYSFYCLPTNTNGEEGTYSNIISTNIDLTPPSVNMTNLSDISTDAFILEWQVDDPTEVQCYDVLWSIDEVNWDYVIYDSEGSEANCINLNSIIFGDHSTSFVDARTYYFQTRVKDQINRIGTSNTVSTTMDLNDPVCTLDNFTSTVTDNKDIVLTWTGSDSASGIKFYDIEHSINTISWNNIANLNGNTFTYTATNQGTHYFRCIATDNVDKTGTSQTVSIIYDDIGPEINVTYKNQIGIGDSVGVNAVITDSIPIRKVNLIYKGDVIPPENLTKVSNYEWEIKWTLSGFSIGGDNFTIFTEDVNFNQYQKTFSFSVEICLPGSTDSCESNIGQCSPGTKVCRSDKRWGPCVNSTGPVAEVCDGLDNNCNGLVDENKLTGNALTRLCGSDIGVCSKGTETCSGGRWGSCNSVTASTEICDGLDNNCDETTDEGCVCISGQTQRCGIDTGACQKGVQTCLGTSWGSCVGEVTPITEICNEADDDCDGSTDEGSVCDTISVAPPDEPDFTWLYLIAAGIGVLIVLAVLIMNFKSHGKELTWTELRNRYSSY